MKRKIYSAFLIMFILLSCLFATACGNKFENMEFKVWYAYSANSTEWIDGTNGISLHYGNDDDELQFDPTTRTAKVYIKIEVQNVKAKHVDLITVSALGLDFSSVTVSQNEIFPISISGNVTTTLKMQEANSKKSFELDFVVSRSITGIRANTDINPAVKVGGTVSFAKLNADANNRLLTCLPEGQTNQTGVTYEVQSIGYYISNDVTGYKPAITDNLERFVTIENGMLRLAGNFPVSSTQYAIKVKATSIYNEEISAEFDVYVVDQNTSFNPKAYFVESGNQGVEVDIINLSYNNKSAEFTTSSIVLNTIDNNSIYSDEGKITLAGDVVYSTSLYINGSEDAYDLDKGETIGGISITKEADIAGKEVYKLWLDNCNEPTTELEIRYVLNGFDFSASQEHFYSKKYIIRKNLLPQQIRVNDTDYANNSNLTDTVYSVTTNTYNGLLVKFAVTPTNNNNSILSIENAGNLIITDLNGRTVDLQNIANNSSVYIKFKEGINDNQTITIKTRITPEMHDGKQVAAEYISVNYTLTKSVTASTIGIYKTEECKDADILDDNKLLFVDSIEGGRAYIKVTYQGTLDKSSVDISSADGALFAGNKAEINLNSATSISKTTDATTGITTEVFSIVVKANEDVASTIDVVAGKGKIGVNKSTKVKAVKTLVEDTAFSVSAISTDKIATLDADNALFAISKNETVKFKVSTADNKDSYIKSLYIANKDVANDNFSKNLLTHNPVANNAFNVIADKGTGKTQAIVVYVSYYAEKDGFIQEIQKPVDVQIAVFEAIDYFEITYEDGKDYVSYVNEFFEDAATTTLTFKAHKAGGGTPATQVVFLVDNEEKTYLNASNVKVKLDAGTEANLKDSIKYTTANGDELNLSDILNTNSGSLGTDLTGKFTLTLKTKIESINQAIIYLTAYRFGIQSLSRTIPVKIKGVDVATEINIQPENLVSYSDELKELQLSFLGVPEDGTVTGSFKASLGFKTQYVPENKVRFEEVNDKNMTYLQYEYLNGLENEPTLLTSPRFNVQFNNGVVIVTAFESNEGGIFKLVLASKDSYMGVNTFTNTNAIIVRISDGSKENRFIINNDKDFAKINSNLKAHYVLGQDLTLSSFTPIGLKDNTTDAITEFEGSFTGVLETAGLTVRHSILLTLNNINIISSTGEGYISSLFAIIGKIGSVFSLDIQLKLDTLSQANALTIGAVAGINKGLIRDVNITVVDYQELSITAGSNKTINLGLVAGVNEGVIDLNNSYVLNEKGIALTLNSALNNTYNIGNISGKNTGEIIGNYAGKADLNTIVFDVLTNLTIINSAPDNAPTIYAGAITGTNTGKIHNIITGGKVSILQGTGTSVQPAVGSIGGIAGQSVLGGEEGTTKGEITTVVALSLDLYAKSTNMLAGGILGSGSVDVLDAKYVTVATEFSFGTMFGRIFANTVAGIIANSTNSSVENSSVEGFVVKANITGAEEVVYTLNGVTAYGLVGGVAEITSSFVSANIDASTIIATSENTEDKSYFVGQVDGTFNKGGATYAIIYNDNDIYKNSVVEESKIKLTDYLVSVDVYKETTAVNADTVDFTNIYVSNGDGYTNATEYVEGTTYYTKETKTELNVAKWQTLVEDFVDITNSQWKIDSTYNTIKVGNIAYFFPYLLTTNGTVIMIERPTDIDAALNSNYIISQNAIYIKDFNLEDYEITETTIINFYEDDAKANTYDLVATYEEIVIDAKTKDFTNIYTLEDGKYVKAEAYEEGKTYYHGKGLIDVTVFPKGAQGGITFEVVKGGTLATITNNKTITFDIVSGNEPIVVRAYSKFNPDIEVYEVFYTQMLLSELVLTSDIVAKTENGYEAGLYTSQTSQLIQLSAENVKNGKSYSSIFASAGIDAYLTLVATGEYSSILDLNTTSTSNISIKIKDSAEFTSGSELTVTFSLYLKGSYFDSENTELYKIGEVDLLITLYQSATDMLLNSNDLYQIQTNESIAFDLVLYTGFVNKNDTEKDISQELEIDGNELYTVDNSVDGIKFVFEEIKEGNERTELNVVLDRFDTTTVSGIADLFNYQIIRKLEKDVLDKVVGYRFTISLSLKDERNYRYICNNINLKLNIIAKNSPNVNGETLITLMPTNVSSPRIENYPVNEIRALSEFQNLITAENVESSVIDPNSKGSIMLIHIQPNYANIVNATLTTNTVPIPSLGGKQVGLRFTQLVYSYKENAYVTLQGSAANVQIDNTLKLAPYSVIYEDGITTDYTGVIYVYVQLEHFSGYEAYFTATLDVESTNGVVSTVEKQLSTSYMPGAYVNYEGLKVGVDNAVQEGTYNNEVKIDVYGYQFNSNPTISFEWVLPENSKYEYVDASKQELKEKGVANGQTWHIGNYISSRLLNNYKDVEENKETGSYTVYANFDVAKGIPAAFKLTANMMLLTKDGQSVTDSDSIIFNPVDYVLDSVYVKNIAGNQKQLVIGTTTKIDLGFTTKNNLNDDSKAIYAKLLSDLGYENIAGLFSYIENGKEVLFSTEQNAHLGFDVNIVNEEFISLTGLAKFSNTINLKVRYGYDKDENGKYALTFGALEDLLMPYAFTLNVLSATTKENAYAIHSVEDMFNSNGECILAEGSYNILMNDIVVENIKPITTAIAGLDGNNRTITIKSFKVDKDITNYGLFGTLGYYPDADKVMHQSLIENVVVDYSQFNEGGLQLTNSEFKSLIFGGLVADNQGGLIYNCDVINKDATTNKTVELMFDDSGSVNVTFGGLVGKNSGVITNSRVGRSTFTRIEASQTKETSITLPTGALTFVLGNDTSTSNKFNIDAGGFVGVNAGTITSSYVANTSVINYSTAEIIASSSKNRTAGFVADNQAGANIYYSYVKAQDTTTTKNPYSTGSVIESKGNGIVAGFVYNNAGTINNSYTNTELVTKSAYIAGFVYTNVTNAVISESYSACTMNSGYVGTNQTYAEQPFVGVDNSGTLLSDGTLENVYYLLNNNYSAETSKNKPQAQALNVDNFGTSENLNGFVFVLSNTIAERKQGIWSYYDLNNDKQLLPVLINADVITHSYKYIVNVETNDSTGTTTTYANALSYEKGSENNPYTIQSVEDYANVFTLGGRKSLAGYVRFINNINFKSTDNGTDVAIPTRIDYTLGDANNSRNITSVEGNGMTISGIYFDTTDTTVKEIGLFAKIENAYIKNLNLNFETPTTENQFSTTTVKYSGGLAGKINNSVILNINLNGPSTTLTGSNYVGGVAGIITGKSLVFGIDTNLSVKATSTNANDLYYSEAQYNALGKQYIKNYADYIGNLSYAGGVAGVIDIQSRSTTGNNSNEHNVAHINVYGNEMFIKTKNNQQEANIIASYVGGVAGYAGAQTNSLRLKYFTGLKEYIRGDKVAGGIYGVLMGKIVASQVTAVEDTQFTYDTTMAQYIMSLTDNPIKATLSTKVEEIGNLSLIESYGYAGGLVGVSVGAEINSSYAKTGFKAGIVIGGLVGTSVATKTTYSYAVPYINLHNSNQLVGGLIGSAYNISASSPERNSAISSFEEIAKQNGVTNASTDVQFTFSTILMDNSKLEKLTTTERNNFPTMDFICADYGANDIANTVLTSNNNENLNYVFAGKVPYAKRSDTAQFVTNTTEARASTINMYELYDVKNTEEQPEAFRSVFSGWSSEKYWSLNNEKYFPLLLNEAVQNFYIISSPDDFKQLVANPNRNYKITQDVEIPADVYSENWIFNVNFTGMLVGEIEGTDKKPVVTIKAQLNPNTKDETAGMFRQTTNATISNLTFLWTNNISLDNVESLNMVAGLTCRDENSLISSVDVHVSAEVNEGYIINETSKSISGFGGLVGSSTNSNIIASSFVGSANVKLNPTEGENVYFGGLVANAMGYNDEATAVNENMSLSESHVGAAGENKECEKTGQQYALNSSLFNIALGQGADAYIGGLIGNAETISSTKNTVGGYNYEDGYKHVQFNIIGSGSNMQFGGLIGKAVDASIKENHTLTSSVINEEFDQALVGGLIGQYVIQSSTSKISNNNVNVLIENNSFATTNLNISAGVGQTAGNVSLIQNLFTGSINAESTATLSTVYAGGAVGYNTTGVLLLQEVMSTADILVGSTGTDNLYAGGLVGATGTYNPRQDGAEQQNISQLSGEQTTVGSVTIVDSVTTGKLVPINASTAKETFVGGLIGNVNSVGNTVETTYSLTSIIADGVANETIAKNKINALFGSVSGDIVAGENVIYSSDIALAPEDNRKQTITEGTEQTVESVYGTNYSGNVLWFNANWHDKIGTTNSIIWSECAYDNATYARVPYLTALETSLKNYGILKQDDTTKELDYIEGSALRPKRIVLEGDKVELTKQDVEEQPFTYYLLQVANANNVTFEGSLNGVLVGSQQDITAVKINSTTIDELSSTFNGFIPAVNKHSAVSNLHLNLSGDIDLIDANITGLIVGLNNGVVFNSSVQGNALTITGENTPVGLIVGKNAGLVSYSFSTAEILSTTASYLGGIAYQNQAKLHSNYFTGYINNETTIAAGIYVDDPATAENDTDKAGYLYNNYMAGIIEKITNSSFTTCATKFVKGTNNYIDKLANMEMKLSYKDDDEKTEDPIFVSGTFDLMKTGSLQGKWIPIVKENALDTLSSAFGFNYNYPVYQFNKYTLDNITDKYEDMSFQTNTGTGYDENTSFKIPHLGVLSSIQSILDQRLSFKVIYDIDGSYDGQNGKEYINWSNYITKTETNSFVKNVAFNGIFTTQKYFKGSSDDSFSKIGNLSGAGLFNNIAGATIQNVVFGNFYNLINSGAVASTVSGDVSITTVAFDDAEITSGCADNASENVFGALFGSIDSGTVTIINFNDEIGDIVGKVTLRSGVQTTIYTGLIAGNMTGGTLTIDDGTNPVPSKLTANFSQSQAEGSKPTAVYAGGLVGKMSAGTISSATKISLSTEERVDYLGGVVGTTVTDQTINGRITIGKITVEIQSDELKVNSFGGVVANAEADITGGGIIQINLGTKLKISGNSKDHRYFGLVAGKSSANISLNSLKVKSTTIIVNCADTVSRNYELSHTQGVGTYIGYQAGDLEIGTNDVETMTFDVAGVANLGGVSGYYESGLIELPSHPELTLRGSTNVGGVFGYVKGNLYVPNSDTSAKNKYVSIFNGSVDLLNSKESTGTEKNNVTTIEIVGTDETDFVFNNFGGLFGWLASDLPEDSIKITNTNLIQLIADEVDITQKYAYNVGGIAGKFTGAYIANATNTGEIEYFTTNSTGLDEMSNAVATSNDGINTLCSAINVGGVFGYVETIEPKQQSGEGTGDGSTADVTPAYIKSIINSNAIVGYQNVGGLIGSLSGKTVTIYGDIKVKYTDPQDGGKEKERYINEDTDTLTFNSESGLGLSSTDGNATGVMAESSSSASVTGVISVGGVVGKIDNSSTDTYTIMGVYTSAKVKGNASVGGIIGTTNAKTSETVKIINNYITDADYGNKEKPAMVYGAYYKFKYVVNQKIIAHNFVPTGVGGVVGTAINTLFKNNVINKVEIGSDVEGVDGDMISTIHNYMLPVNLDSNESSNPVLSVTKITEDTDKLQFAEVKSGFGGFAGNIDSNTVATDIESNFMNEIKIDARAGINVGTYYGLYGSGELQDNNGTKVYFKAPQLYGDVSVDGSYNIGGLMGNAEGEIHNISNKDLVGKATIKLQANYTGMYVGGLFGKTGGSLTGIKIVESDNIDIDIYGTDSFYVGGLIGRAELYSDGSISGDVGEWNVVVNDNGTPNESSDDNIVASYISNGNILANSDIEKGNFGGLIGMLKIGESNNANGFNVEVRGMHRYYFTVNTIENSNYFDGNTAYSAKDADNAIELYAQAYYINLDKIAIKSSLKEDVDKDSPFNTTTDTWGWAKDYTIAKTIQRCIPISKNNGAEWDSVSVIYDAEFIKGVQVDDGVIVYTVYEEESGQPKVYTKDYIGTILIDGENDYIEDYNATVIVDAIKRVAGKDLTDTHNDYICKHNYAGTEYYFLQAKTYSPTSKAESGSIFEVNGYSNNDSLIEGEDHSSDNWWMYLVAAIIAVAALVGMYFTGGQSMWLLKISFSLCQLAIMGSGMLFMAAMMQDMMAQNQQAQTIFINKVNQGEGFLSGVYSKGVRFENGKHVPETDNILEINGQTFQPYSYTRPSDYYSNRYWMLQVLLENNKVKAYNKSDKESEYVASTNEYRYLGKYKLEASAEAEIEVYEKDGKYYAKYNYYVFYAGEYFINMAAMKIVQIPTNDLFTIPKVKISTLGENVKYEEITEFAYKHEYGYNYIHGEANRTNGDFDYQFKKLYNNLVEGYEKDEKGEYVTVEYGDYKIYKNIYAEQTFNYKYDDNFMNVKDARYIENYDWIVGAYYTPQERYNTNNENTTRSAIFTYYATDNTPTYGVEDVDYIKIPYLYYKDVVDDETGEVSQEVYSGYYYYVLESFEDTNSDLSIEKLSTISTQGEEHEPALKIQVYASTFKNPYVDIYTGKTKMFENSQDENCYTIDNDNKGKIAHTVRYFLYIGGFKVEELDGEQCVYTPIAEETYDATLNVEIIDRGVAGGRRYATLKDAAENWETYKNATLTGQTITLEEIYLYDNGIIYEPNGRYSINTEGVLCRNYVSYPNSNRENYNQGKYLSHAGAQFYTRYMYTAGIAGTNIGWVIGDVSYYVIPKDFTKDFNGSPNVRTTTFVEAVKVCLSASSGGIYYPADNSSAKDNGGKISIL